MREIQEEFRTKKIEIDMNLSTDVKDLLKCVLRRNPDHRYNIKQVLEHPCLINRVEEFSRPITEDQYALLITCYMQNCGMSTKRDHPDEIKKYKASHKDLETDFFGTGEDLNPANFFDDITVNVPSSSYYGPIPTPFFGTDPGFFDNINANLAFKKSKADSRRIVPEGGNSGSKANASIKNMFQVASPVESIKRDSGYEQRQTGSQRVLMTMDLPRTPSNSGSVRDIYLPIQSQTSLTRNMSGLNPVSIPFRNSHETPGDKQPVSIKVVSSEYKPSNQFLNIPVSQDQQPESTRLSTETVQNGGKNQPQISKLFVTGETFSQKQFINNEVTLNRFENHNQLLKPQSLETGQALIQQVRLETYATNKGTPTSSMNAQSIQPNYQRHETGSDPSSIRFVNHTPLSAHVSKPVSLYVNEFSLAHVEMSESIFQPTPESTNIKTETVRYFPYEIQEYDQIQTPRNLNEHLNRQTEPEKRSFLKNPLNFVPELMVKKTDLGIERQGVFAAESPKRKVLITAPPVKPSVFISNNMTFVNYNQQPAQNSQANTRPNAQAPQIDHRNIFSQEPRHGSFGNRVFLPPLPNKELETNRFVNVKYDQYFEDHGSSTIRNEQKTQYLPVASQFGQQKSGLTGDAKISGVYRPGSRPVSVEKNRDFSAGPGRNLGRQYITTYKLK